MTFTRTIIRIAVVGALAGVGCSSDGTSTEATTTSTPASADPVDEFAILGGPDWMAVDDGRLYVRRDNGGVDEIDTATGDVVRSVEIDGDPCQGIGTLDGAVWSCAGSDIVRLDMEAGTVEATIPVGKSYEQGTLAGGFGRLWVLTGDGSRLVGIDPATNSVADTFDIGVRGTDLAVSDDGIWVVSLVGSSAVRVDPTDGAVTVTATDLDEPTTIAVSDAGDVWVGGGTTVRIDAATGSVGSTIDGRPGAEGAITTVGDDVLIRSEADFVQRFDGVDGERVLSWDAPKGVTSGGDVAVAGGFIWASAYDDATLVRISIDD